METLVESWKNQNAIFLISGNQQISYAEFYNDLVKLRSLIRKHFKKPALFVVESFNSYETYLKFLALILEKHIVFLSPEFQFNDNHYRKMLEEETSSAFNYVPAGQSLIAGTDFSVSRNELLLKQMSSHSSGFIVRTSGTSGKKFKFILHSPGLFIKKYKVIKNHFKTTLAFSPVDSIAGIETLLEVLTHSNTLVTDVNKLTPLFVGELIELRQIDYFQTTPSFLNLMLIARVFSTAKLSELKKIAYGSEPALKAPLNEIKKQLPHTEFKHTYGMSEFGILATVTNQDDPTTFILDTKINEGRVTEGVLEIKVNTLAIGYLNYQNTKGPWFKTGDVPSFEDNGFMKIIGRADDLINLAGRKFYPSEVEDLLIHISGVSDVAVFSEKNEIVGNIIVANFYLKKHVDESDFRRAFKIYCEEHVPNFMVPHKVLILKNPPITSRFKKSRLA